MQALHNHLHGTVHDRKMKTSCQEGNKPNVISYSVGSYYFFMMFLLGAFCNEHTPYLQREKSIQENIFLLFKKPVAVAIQQ